MKTVGQVLQEERLNKGITLNEAERSTKIRTEILARIEQDNFEGLPAATVVKGFIKNYGEFLGLDSEKLLALFRRQFDESKATPGEILPDLSPKEGPRFVVTPGRALGLGVTILVLGFAGYLLAQYQSFAAAPALLVAEPSDNLRVNNGTVEVAGRTDRDARLAINGQDIQLTESGAFSVSVSLPDGVTELTIRAVNKLGRVTTVKKTVAVETAAAKEPLGPVATSSATPQVAAATAPVPAQPVAPVEVTVKVGPNSSYIEVTLDGQEAVKFRKLFTPNTTQTFKAQQSVKLLVGNAGSTEVTLNGQSLGRLGDEAQVVTKTFSH